VTDPTPLRITPLPVGRRASGFVLVAMCRGIRPREARSTLRRHRGVIPCCARIITSLLALTPGTRLGVYEVTAQIGEGGMGQVYRATDTTLGRQVAIKILPDAFAADPERLARFEREAKTLASLNHPHIAAVYGFEQSGGMQFLKAPIVIDPGLTTEAKQSLECTVRFTEGKEQPDVMKMQFIW